MIYKAYAEGYLVADAKAIAYLKTKCKSITSSNTFKLYVEDGDKRIFLGVFKRVSKKYIFTWDLKGKSAYRILLYGDVAKLFWFEGHLNEIIIKKAYLLGNLKYILKNLDSGECYDIYYVSSSKEAKIATYDTASNSFKYLSGYNAAMRYVRNEQR